MAAGYFEELLNETQKKAKGYFVDSFSSLERKKARMQTG
jgi:hypothetical protein